MSKKSQASLIKTLQKKARKWQPKNIKEILWHILLGVVSFIAVTVVVSYISTWLYGAAVDQIAKVIDNNLQSFLFQLSSTIPGILTLFPIIYSIRKRQWGILVGAVLALLLIYTVAVSLYINVGKEQEEMKEVEDPIEVDQEAAKKKMQEIFNTLQSENGGRVELNEEVMEKIGSMMPEYKYHDPLCHARFNSDAPNQRINIQDPAGEISLSIPYNKAWGNEYIKIPPYVDTYKNGNIDFGPISTIGEGGCSWGRFSSLERKDQAPADKVMEDLRTYSNLWSGEENSPSMPKIKRINAVEVVSFVSHEFCSVAVVEVIGKKNNYKLSDFCGGEKALPELEKIAASIKFL